MPTMAELASEGLSGPEEAGGPVEACTANEGPARPARAEWASEWISAGPVGKGTDEPRGPSIAQMGQARWPCAQLEPVGYTTSSMIRLLMRAEVDLGGMWPMRPGVTLSGP